MSQNEDFEHEMSQRLGQMSASHDVAAQVSYMIFGAAATTTRAFEKVVVKVEPGLNRVFVAITLRWFAKYKKMKPLREAWLRRADQRCKEHAPTGYKVLCYYEGFNEGK
jgi:hypothetical protein